MTKHSGIPANYRGRDQMDLGEFIDDIEKCHFRTAHDTGANPCAMMIWNGLREWYGVDSLTIDDLHANHARTDGISVEQVKADYKAYEQWKRDNR